jgi:hypothetical protein
VKDLEHSPVSGERGDLEEAAVFTSLRPRLFGIAYRMLSSASEAEDLVQEVGVPIDQWLSDPADDQRYETGLRTFSAPSRPWRTTATPATGRDRKRTGVPDHGSESESPAVPCPASGPHRRARLVTRRPGAAPR